MSQSYAIYLYANDLIQWDLHGALAGYNAGNGLISFTVPVGSELIAFSSNVRRPGMWVFRLDREDIGRFSCVNSPNGNG